MEVVLCGPGVSLELACWTRLIPGRSPLWWTRTADADSGRREQTSQGQLDKVELPQNRTRPDCPPGLPLGCRPSPQDSPMHQGLPGKREAYLPEVLGPHMPHPYMSIHVGYSKCALDLRKGQTGPDWKPQMQTLVGSQLVVRGAVDSVSGQSKNGVSPILHTM